LTWVRLLRFQTYKNPLSFEPEDSRNNNDNIDYIKEEMNNKQE
jgi:hypothetical protein